MSGTSSEGRGAVQDVTPTVEDMYVFWDIHVRWNFPDTLDRDSILVSFLLL